MSILKRLTRLGKSNFNSLFNTDSEIGIDLNTQETSNNMTKQVDNLLKEAEYYANLELKNGASFQEIKNSYKTLLKKYHPDLFPQGSENQKQAITITKKLNEAIDYFENKYK